MVYSHDHLDPQNDLYEHFSFAVDKGQQPLRIDKYLMNFVENATRKKIQAAAKSGHIFVNEVEVKSSYKVKPEDQIRVMFAHPPHENLLVAENIPIDVWVDETRHRNQGGMTARELQKHGISTTNRTDNADGQLMQKGLVEMDIGGTDRRTAQGDVSKKIGTYSKSHDAHDKTVSN